MRRYLGRYISIFITMVMLSFCGSYYSFAASAAIEIKLTAKVGNSGAILSWETKGVNASEIIGYNLYRGISPYSISSVPITDFYILEKKYTDQYALDHDVLYYICRAIYRDGTLSNQSNIIKVDMKAGTAGDFGSETNSGGISLVGIAPGNELKGTISLKASFPGKLKEVQYYIIPAGGSGKLSPVAVGRSGDSWPAQYDTAKLINGDYDVVANGVKEDGSIVYGERVRVVIRNTPVGLEISSSKGDDGKYSGNIYLSAKVRDSSVSTVDYYIDNKYIATGFAKENFEVRLNTRAYSDGKHVLAVNGKKSDKKTTIYGSSAEVSFRNPIRIKLNGEYIETPVEPYIDTVTNRLMLPLSLVKDIFYITISPIQGNKISARSLFPYVPIEFTIGSSIIKYNNKDFDCGTKVAEKNGCIYVPVKFFADKYNVDYKLNTSEKCLEINYTLSEAALNSLSSVYKNIKNIGQNILTELKSKSSPKTPDYNWHKLKNSKGEDIQLAVSNNGVCLLKAENMEARRRKDGGVDISMDIYNIKYLKIGSGFFSEYSPAYIDAVVVVFDKNRNITDMRIVDGYRIDSSVKDGYIDLYVKWKMQNKYKYNDYKNPWYSELTQITKDDPVHVPPGGYLTISKGDNYALAYNLLRLTLDAFELSKGLSEGEKDDKLKEEIESLKISLMKDVFLPVAYEAENEFQSVKYGSNKEIKEMISKLKSKAMIKFNEWYWKKIEDYTVKGFSAGLGKLLVKMAEKKSVDLAKDLAANITAAGKLIKIFEAGSGAVDLVYQGKDLIYNYYVVSDDHKIIIINGNGVNQLLP